MDVQFALVASVILALGLSLGACHRQETDSGPAQNATTGSNDLETQPGGAAERAEQKPNVIWLVLDACRAQNLGCYGYARPTSPNIDGLAAQGEVFEQHYAQADWTPRSVPSYMTGRYFATSCLDLLAGQQFIRTPPPGERLLPELLRDEGYATYLFSGHRAIFRPGCRLWDAFDTSVDVPKRDMSNPLSTQRTLGDICDYLFPQLEAGLPRPFFLYIHAIDTHFPHFLSPPYDQWLDKAYSTDHLDRLEIGQRIVRKDGRPYSEKDKEYITGLYDGGINYVDAQIGRLLAKLDELDLTENTIVILGSDHGEALGEDGRNMGHFNAGYSDEVLRIPLIMAGPGITGGGRVGSITENVDIFPTLVDILNLNFEVDELDGRSLFPLLRQPDAPPVHDTVFAWCGGGTYEEPGTFVLANSQYKYEYELSSKVEHLWRMPDLLGQREDVLGAAPDDAGPMRTRLLTERIPAWRQFLSLPVTAIELKSAYIARSAENAKSAVCPGYENQPGLRSDGKWADGFEWMWSCPWQEDAPPLTLRFPLPKGGYRVSVLLYDNQDYEGRPASSLSLKLEDEGEFRLVTRSERKPDDAQCDEVVLGDYDIRDGLFDLTLDEGDRQCWAGLAAIRLVPIEAGKPGTLSTETNQTPEQLRDQAEAMRAMGYLQ